MDFALGELGLLPDVFWDMSWQDYERACKGYRIRQDREWERTRLICTQVVNMMAQKPIQPHEYMWLSTDQEAQQSTAETTEEFWDRMQRNNFYQPAPTPHTAG